MECYAVRLSVMSCRVTMRILTCIDFNVWIASMHVLRSFRCRVQSNNSVLCDVIDVINGTIEFCHNVQHKPHRFGHPYNPQQQRKDQVCSVILMSWYLTYQRHITRYQLNPATDPKALPRSANAWPDGFAVNGAVRSAEDPVKRPTSFDSRHATVLYMLSWVRDVPRYSIPRHESRLQTPVYSPQAEASATW